MALIKDNKNINDIISTSKKYYKDIFKGNVDNIQIYASDNIPVDIKLFSDNIVSPNDLNKLYGGYIEPNIKSSIPVILIKYNAFRENGAPFAGTILHELTHASDFEQFNLEYCSGNWLYLRKHKYYSAMCRWSEYHAKIVEIVHMRMLTSILYPDKYVYDLKFIRDEMINYQLHRYNNEIAKLIDDNDATLDTIFQYCGRLYVCKTYENQLNIKDIIPKQVYEVFPDIIFLYNWLEPLQTYTDISPHLDELTSLLCNFI